MVYLSNKRYYAMVAIFSFKVLAVENLFISFGYQPYCMVQWIILLALLISLAFIFLLCFLLEFSNLESINDPTFVMTINHIAW
jgi:hypothetical protein